MHDKKKLTFKRRALNKFGQVGLSLLSASLILGANTASAVAIDAADAAKAVVGSERIKEVLNQALKVARSKPSLSITSGITCITCLPTARIYVSPSMCVACGILIAKTLG